jgi:predicted MFS family arabinose efflux permease
VPKHLLAFVTTTLLVTGGYMIMPFGSVYTVNNLGIPLAELPTVYFASGLFTIVTGPLVGRASDAFGKFNTFIFGCALSIVMVLIYTHLGHASLFVVVAVSVLMFVGIFSRMIPSQTLMSAIPEPAKRGSFNAINASMQQMAGGMASVVAGMVVVQAADGSLEHFDRLGYVIVATTLLSLWLMYFIQRSVAQVAR